MFMTKWHHERPDLEELVEMESILLVSLMGKQRPEEGRELTKVTWMDIRSIAELLLQSGSEED